MFCCHTKARCWLKFTMPAPIRVNQPRCLIFSACPPLFREHYRGSPEDLIVQQIMNLFDTGAANPPGNIVQDWSREPFTQNKLYFGGSETPKWPEAILKARWKQVIGFLQH